MLVQENIALAPLTTLRVGGPARFFVEAQTADDVRDAVLWARTRRLPCFVLGGGSNLVVSDSGFPGLILKIALRGVEEKPVERVVEFTGGAGEDWDGFVARAVERGCAGLECLSGIPGTVGASPVQNVGAYGQEVAETIVRVEVFDTATSSLQTIGRDDCQFAYRHSIFNSSAHGRYIILRVTFALHPGAQPKLAYGDLQRYFSGRAPSLMETREAVCRIRRDKGMVWAEDLPESRSAGSFFKNPVLTAEAYARLQARAARRGLTIPCYPALSAHHKIPAAWLVENSGFSRGYVRGQVGISPFHALAIINRGGATAADVVALKNEIQQAVREQFDLELQPEPVFLGFAEPSKV